MTTDFEIPIKITSEQVGEFLDARLHETVATLVQQSIPSASDVSMELTGNANFVRKVRDWLMESISYNDITDCLINEISFTKVISALDISEEKLSDIVMRGWSRDGRLNKSVESIVINYINSEFSYDRLSQNLEKYIDAKTVEIADLVMSRIINSLKEKVDE
jgi:hypothetical protein